MLVAEIRAMPANSGSTSMATDFTVEDITVCCVCRIFLSCTAGCGFPAWQDEEDNLLAQIHCFGKVLRKNETRKSKALDHEEFVRRMCAASADEV